MENKVKVYAVLLVLLAFAAWSWAAYPPGFQVFFNNASEGESNDIDTELIAFIDSAQVNISAHFYQINHMGIVDAFVRAANRLGPCNVRIISDAHYSQDPNPDYNQAYKALIDAGIPVIDETCDGSSDQSEHSHNKFCIVDEEAVWTGSYNITHNGTFNNNNNAVLIEDAGLAQAFLTEFNEMWGSSGCVPGCGSTSKFGNKKADNTAHNFNIGGVQVEAYFAPSDGCEQAILNELSAVDQGVYFCIFVFTTNSMGDSMIASYDSGYEIMGVFDNLQAWTQYSEGTKMRNHGMPVKADSEVDPHGDLLHHKFMVIDPYGHDPTVITGSYNWTASAEEDNDENILIIHDPVIAQAYYQEFLKRYYGDEIPTAELVITEVMANPLEESTGEFIEIYNYGTTSVDMTGFKITDGDSTEELFSYSGGDMVLGAGKYALILDPDYAGEYSIPSGTLLLTTGDSAIGNGLSVNDPVTLYGSDGSTVISTYAHPFNPGNGISAEKIDILGADTADNWAASTCASGSSPGEVNCVSPQPNTAPEIYALGYLGSYISSQWGGNLDILVMVDDADGWQDVTDVQILMGGSPSGLHLSLDNHYDETVTSWTFHGSVSPGAARGDYLLEFVATDSQGNQSNIFPYITIYSETGAQNYRINAFQRALVSNKAIILANKKAKTGNHTPVILAGGYLYPKVTYESGGILGLTVVADDANGVLDIIGAQLWYGGSYTGIDLYSLGPGVYEVAFDVAPGMLDAGIYSPFEALVYDTGYSESDLWPYLRVH